MKSFQPLFKSKKEKSNKNLQFNLRDEFKMAQSLKNIKLFV